MVAHQAVAGVVAPQEPMLARPATLVPAGAYAFEPKFDGYRGLLFVHPDGCLVQSRAGHDITQCFPDIAAAASSQMPSGCVVDGELVVWAEDEGTLNFPALPRRIVSPLRAAALAEEEPATFMAFDLLAADGEDLRGRSLVQRRRRLEELASSWSPPLELTPQTTDPAVARRWLADYAAAPVGVEGIVMKRLNEGYKPGKRSWLKLRIRRTVEAIVGAVTGPVEAPERLVLALPGRAKSLLVAGVTTPLRPAQSREVGALLRPADARHPWPPELPAGRMGAFAREPVTITLVDPTLVVEVEADTAFEFGKWRHPTRFVRARPDLPPGDITPPVH
jgi:ATP-dependent DNA ligase